jgi:hypothetical protein
VIRVWVKGYSFAALTALISIEGISLLFGGVFRLSLTAFDWLNAERLPRMKRHEASKFFFKLILFLFCPIIKKYQPGLQKQERITRAVSSFPAQALS